MKPAYQPSKHFVSVLNQNARDIFKAQTKRALDSNKRRPIIEWVEANRVIDGDSEPGPKRVSRTPYLRDIYRDLESQDPRCQIVAMAKGTQLALSDLCADYILWNIDSGLPSLMYLSETAEKARLFARTRLRPQFSRKPFTAYIPPASSNTGEHSIGFVKYPGGALTIWGTGSTSSFSSTPARTVLADEFARYSDSIGSSATDAGEGSPLDLLEGRTRTFGNRKKIIVPSTPVGEEGAFMELVESGDYREYFVPCPKCGNMDYLRDENLHGLMEDGEPVEAWFVCANEKCGHHITEKDKTQMLDKGEWRPTRKAKAYRVRSYHISSFLSPKGWTSWAECFEFREQAKKGIGKRTMQAYYNTILGLPYTPTAVSVEPPDAMKAHHYKQSIMNSCPAGPDFVTMACDVHTGRNGWLRWEKKAWFMPNFKSYSISKGTIAGRLATTETQERLRAEILKPVIDDDGEVHRPTLCFIDAGDGNTEGEVMDFCAGWSQASFKQIGNKCYIHDSPAVMGFKGDINRIDNDGLLIKARRYTPKKGSGYSHDVRMWHFATNLIKLELYQALAEPADSDKVGIAKFPTTYDEGYWRELLSEPADIVFNKSGGKVLKFGRPRRGQRNEGLDTHTMNRAAADVVASHLEVNAKESLGNVGKEELEKTKPQVSGAPDDKEDEPPPEMPKAVETKAAEIAGSGDNPEANLPKWVIEQAKRNRN